MEIKRYSMDQVDRGGGGGGGGGGRAGAEVVVNLFCESATSILKTENPNLM